jgi:hypothetical protein
MNINKRVVTSSDFVSEICDIQDRLASNVQSLQYLSGIYHTLLGDIPHHVLYKSVNRNGVLSSAFNEGVDA